MAQQDALDRRQFVFDAGKAPVDAGKALLQARIHFGKAFVVAGETLVHTGKALVHAGQMLEKRSLVGDEQGDGILETAVTGASRGSFPPGHARFLFYQ